MSVTRVGIIGAGSAGLAQLKQVLDAFRRPNVGSKLEVVCFEARDEVGGVWLSDMKPKPYLRADLPSTTKPDVDQLYFYPRAGEMPSPMYEGLRTNLPYDLMSYRDFPMPPQSELFSDRGKPNSALRRKHVTSADHEDRIQRYLEDYASHFQLRQHIRFRHIVDRLYQARSAERRRWTIGYSNRDGRGEEDFDFVCVANGHYADGWIPEIPGLSSFKGEIQHSRYFLKPADYEGKTVLVVGSFASGGDISRLIASQNIGRFASDGQLIPSTPDSENGHDKQTAAFTKVYVSASGTNKHSPQPGDPSQPWTEFITFVPLISHVDGPTSDKSNGTIHLTEEADSLLNIDIIIFATGYNFIFPFCKVMDQPWCDQKLLDGQVRQGERPGGDTWEVGGMKGLGVKELDESMVFLEGDRSIAFPVLQYQVVPFPFAEIQTRLTSLLWAGLLPSFPEHPRLPPHPSNPYYTPPDTPRSSTPTEQHEAGKASAATPSTPPRKVLSMRQKLVIGAGYEWTYMEWLMRLMSEADKAENGNEYTTEEHWRRIEEWRKERRADTDLRKRTLGY